MKNGRLVRPDLVPPFVNVIFYDKEPSRRRYAPSGFATLRHHDVCKVLRDRYPPLGILPDDDAGREDLFIVANGLAHMPGDPVRRIVNYAALFAPWAKHADVVKLAKRISENPYKYSATTLGEKFNLSAADRSRLKVFTIGAAGTTKKSRLILRRKKAREREQKRREANGAKPRCEAMSNLKPWLAFGWSRAKWYRNGKPSPQLRSSREQHITKEILRTNSSHQAEGDKPAAHGSGLRSLRSLRPRGTPSAAQAGGSGEGSEGMSVAFSATGLKEAEAADAA